MKFLITFIDTYKRQAFRMERATLNNIQYNSTEFNINFFITITLFYI